MPDDDGKTLLHMAAEQANLPALQYLLGSLLMFSLYLNHIGKSASFGKNYMKDCSQELQYLRFFPQVKNDKEVFFLLDLKQ